MHAQIHWHNDGDLTPGSTVYLVEEIHNGRSRVVARIEPGRTNISREPKARGWLGETNNVSRWAIGAATVTRVFKNGRVLVRRLSDAAVAAPR